ncbi:MAG: DUF4332 domain-containing protein [Bacteroidota bacterium]|nr:DUF4332 domain-containing protein [Bacteroidota bacterium]
MKPYSIDPDLLSLEEFWDLIANRRMLPGRSLLQEQMKERFDILGQSGIKNLGELLRMLGTKTKIQSAADRTGLSVDYLVLLKREAGSYLAKPFPLSNFPGIPFEYVELLKSGGIRNTRDLFEQVQDEEVQHELSTSTGIPAYRLKELSILCDLSRITGVGGIFARVLYETGIRSTQEFAGTDVPAILKRCQAVINKHGYAAGKLGEKDIEYGINYANVVVACDRKTDKQ